MKKMKGMVFSIVLFGIGIVQADTIKSVPSGGLWSNPLTWVGNTVPGKNDSVLIRGTVSIADSTVCRYLTIADSAILQNSGSSKHVTLAITEAIMNNGTLRNSPDSNDIWLELYGDAMNNGMWTPSRTFFALKDTQTIAQSLESEFGGALYMTDAVGLSDHYPLVAASDLIINAKTFDGTGRSSSGEWQGKVDMAGHNLKFLGGTGFTKVDLFNSDATGPTGLTWYDSSTVSNCTFESNVTIGGVCTATDSKVVFKGDVLIFSGTLQNGGTIDSVVVVRIYGNINNLGTFCNNQNGAELWLELYGDLYNAGMWKPARTYIASRKKQTISMILQSPFDGNFYTTAADSSTDTFPLVATSDIKFYGKEFNCTKKINDLACHGKFDMGTFNLLLQNGAYFSGADLSRTKLVTCLDSSMVGDCVFRDPVQACGNFKVALQGVYFLDTLTVVDTLENGVGGCCIAQGMLFAQGGIVNKGVIRDNPKQFKLWCQIGRNINNSGIWKNEKNILTDSVEQVVTLENGKPVTSLFQFDGMWPSSPYAWQKDGQNLAGDTVRFLTVDSLVETSAGVYRCKHDAALSRTITVVWEGATVRDPEKRTSGTPSAFGCVFASGVKPALLFQAPYATEYTLALYDIRGRLVQFSRSHVSAGYHSVALPRQGLATGAYAIKFRAARFEKAMRVTIVR